MPLLSSTGLTSKVGQSPLTKRVRRRRVKVVAVVVDVVSAVAAVVIAAAEVAAAINAGKEKP